MYFTELFQSDVRSVGGHGGAEMRGELKESGIPGQVHNRSHFSVSALTLAGLCMSMVRI